MLNKFKVGKVKILIFLLFFSIFFYSFNVTQIKKMVCIKFIDSATNEKITNYRLCLSYNPYDEELCKFFTGSVFFPNKKGEFKMPSSSFFKGINKEWCAKNPLYLVYNKGREYCFFKIPLRTSIDTLYVKPAKCQY